MTSAAGALFKLRHTSDTVHITVNTQSDAERIRADVEAWAPGTSWRLAIRVAG